MNIVSYCLCGCGEKTPPAKATDHRSGLVKGEPVRYLQGHKSRNQGPDIIEEDCGHVTPCWIWQRALDLNGYGYVSARIAGKQMRAHRYYYQTYVGEIPEGLQIDHLCRVRRCVNPDHLEAVDGATNTRRGSNAKLNIHAVEEIRRLVLVESRTQRSVAKMYGVRPSLVCRILKGQRWRQA